MFCFVYAAVQWILRVGWKLSHASTKRQRNLNCLMKQLRGFFYRSGITDARTQTRLMYSNKNYIHFRNFKASDDSLFIVQLLFNVFVWCLTYCFFAKKMKTSPLRSKTTKCRPERGTSGLWAGRDLLSCHTCCDTGRRLLHAHPKDRHNFFTFYNKQWVMRGYFSLNPHGACAISC